MYEQGYITQAQYDEGIKQALPAPSDIEPPKLDSKAPYFTAWLRQQLVDRYGAAKAFFGGLKVKTTLDLRLQDAAEEAVNSYLGYLPPTASVVVLDNHNAGVKAMVGGPDFETKPFNLATQGHRQPGSSIKPFTLITALEEGISPYTVYESAPQEFHFGKHGKEVFVVHNDEDSYLGSCDIVCATTYSDNSIYAQLGAGRPEGQDDPRPHPLDRRRRSTRWATRTRSRPTRRWSWAGSKEGVTPLGWTYAYIDDRQRRRPGQRHPGAASPATARSPTPQVTDQDGHTIKGGDNDSIHTQVISRRRRRARRRASSKRWSAAAPASTPTSAPPASGARPARPRTTATPGSAAATDEVTACVWVGYADSTTPMTTLYNGGPVMGGTFPALIWASVISAWEQIKAERARRTRRNGKSGSASGSTYVPSDALDRTGTGAERHPPNPKPEPRRTAPTAGPEPAAAAPNPRHRRRAAPSGGAIGRRRRRRQPPASRPRARAGDERAAGGAEAPGPLDRFGDADPGPGDAPRRSSPARAAAAGRARCRGRRRWRRGRCRAPRSACPGPSRARGRGGRRAARASASRPAVGSSARISTAAASPSGSATALSRLWMP